MVEDSEHSCCPSTCCTDEKTQRKFLNCHQQLTKYHFGDWWKVRPLCGTFCWIRKEGVNMRQISTKLVLWLLTDEQVQWKFLAAENWLYSPILITWLEPVWFPLVSKSEIASMRALFSGSLKFRNVHWLSYMQLQEVISTGAATIGINDWPFARTQKEIRFVLWIYLHAIKPVFIPWFLWY